ncbi:hypothetical protein QWY81_17920 [Polaribacter undariae]|uniref:Uncharacterized protein n=1 Tax=Polaribacter sejongensis TaxID=985043 RepID=A0AAJ1R1M6_9FLAO|nr:hypothetical protein [Polaribacter undariae]MDN3621350.1 hypothetical protein [Polaribacter undariae]UWD31892.1 hypothetical protein NQP51_17385 [Polaribacter undariae]
MKALIEELIRQNIPLTLDVGTVKKVSGDTCHVESLTTEKDFFKCRLNAIEKNGSNYLKCTPKVNSTVVFGIFKDTEKAIIVSTSEVEAIEYKIGETFFKIDESGFVVKKGSENLGTILGDLMDEVNKIVVLYGNNINKVEVAAIKQRLKGVLKE